MWCQGGTPGPVCVEQVANIAPSQMLMGGAAGHTSEGAGVGSPVTPPQKDPRYPLELASHRPDPQSTPQALASFPLRFDAKMPSPRTVTSGPEPQHPTEPTQPRTPKQAQRRASSGDAPSPHHDDAWPSLGLGTLRRAFVRASQRVPKRTTSRASSKEDAGRLLRSPQVLFRSLRRRAPDHSPAAEQLQRTASLWPAQDAEGPTQAAGGISRQVSASGEPETPEPEAGEDQGWGAH